MSNIVEELPNILTLLHDPIAAFPIPNDIPLTEEYVKSFGVSGLIGLRKFQTGLEITIPPPYLSVDVLAILEGTISRIGGDVPVGPPRGDDTTFVTKCPGLLLKVNPKVDFHKAIKKNPEYPLELPPPVWVIYEGAELSPDLINQNSTLELEVSVKAGDKIGTYPDSISITVLDILGFYRDPVDIVLRLRPELLKPDSNGHINSLVSTRNHLAPAVASNYVRCVSDDCTNDGAEYGQSSDLHFEFYASLGDAVEYAETNDIVWIDKENPIRSNITINSPMSLIGQTRENGDLPEIKPDTNQIDKSILDVNISDYSEYGFWIIGLKLSEGKSLTGGAAINIKDTQNIHVRNCSFEENWAGQSFIDLNGNGGAIKIINCQFILIESTFFQGNSALKGGAIFVNDCLSFVLTGSECSTIGELLQPESELPDLNNLNPSNHPIIGNDFDTLLINNKGVKAGGGICLINTTFRISNAYFAENDAKPVDDVGYGGAVAVQVYDDKISKLENYIYQSVVIKNKATFGGGFGAIGESDGATYLNVNPGSEKGGGIVKFQKNVLYCNKGYQIGGGFHLLSGIYSIESNRIENNSAFRNGGGISCMAGCRVRITENNILRNRIFRNEPNKPPGGGGGIYVCFWPVDYPDITLRDNLIAENKSTEDGGGLRATCGSRVTLAPGNVFRGNFAFRNGGGISIRNSHLIIQEGNHFEDNQTRNGGSGHHRGGDGGAIYCAGAKPLTHNIDPMEHPWDYISAFIQKYSFSLCTLDGSILKIKGTSSDNILFRNNSAIRHGSAVYINQETAITTETITIGDINGVELTNVIFENNYSSESIRVGSQTYVGSSLKLDGLNTTPSRGFLIKDVIIRSKGVGIYLVNSNVIEIENVKFEPVDATIPSIDIVRENPS